MASSADEADKAIRTRGGRGAFPRRPLKEALRLIEVIYDEGHGDPVRLSTAFEKFGRSPASDSSRQLIVTANRGYGLITGNKSSSHLGLTDRAIAYMTATSDDQRRLIAWEALSSNPIFQGFVEKYTDHRLPSSEVIVDVLASTHGLNSDDAKTFLGVAMENLEHLNLMVSEGGRKVIIKPESPHAVSSKLTEIASDSATDADSPNGADISGLVSPVANSISTGMIQPQIAFNIQIQLPDNASPDTYREIFRNIAIHLLGRPED